MFAFYLKLQLRSCLRLMKAIGVLRSLFLLCLFLISYYILLHIEQDWLLPSLDAFVLFAYNQNRKDKSFLKQHIKHVKSFLRKEYMVLASPVLITMLFQKNYWASLILFLYAGLLPYVKNIRWKKRDVVPLLFLSKAGLDSKRQFRQYFWLYMVLLFFSGIGAWQNNPRILQFSLLFWGFFQSTAFYSLPERLHLLHYKDFVTFYKLQWLVNIQNVGFLILPFVILLLGFYNSLEYILFAIGAYCSTVFYLQAVCMLRFILQSSMRLFLINICLFFPLYIASAFNIWILIPFLLIILFLSYNLWIQLRAIWS